MSIRRNPSMSDRRLRALLKQLRENPAAPQDFRARVLDRLAGEGLLPSTAAPKAGWLDRLAPWLRPAPMGLAAACALALVLVLRPSTPPLPQAQVPAAGPAQAAGPSVKAALAGRPRHAKKTAPPDRAPFQPAQGAGLDLASVQPPVQSQPPEAVGAAAAPHAESVVHVAGVVATPTFNPSVSKPYPDSSSEVRNNVVRISNPDPSLAFADVHFSFVTSGHVRADVLDRLGRTVAVLFDGQMSAGEYDGGTRAPGASPCQWCLWNNQTVNGSTAASGIYLVRVQTPDYVHIHKLMLIK
jgi:hypothetical protein